MEDILVGLIEAAIRFVALTGPLVWVILTGLYKGIRLIYRWVKGKTSDSNDEQ